MTITKEQALEALNLLTKDWAAGGDAGDVELATLLQFIEQQPGQDDKDAQRLASENADLRQWLCDVLRGLRNGSGASPQCSMQFLSSIPEEVRLEVEGLHARIAAIQSEGKRHD